MYVNIWVSTTVPSVNPSDISANALLVATPPILNQRLYRFGTEI
jgi:hypothetical protein